MNEQRKALLRLDRVSGGYGDHTVLHEISFQLHQGEFLSLLGPNGSGKTTLLRLITGLLPKSGGRIDIEGIPIEQLTTTERAQKIAVLSQEESLAFDYTVEEVVSLGRYPHQRGWVKRNSAQDRHKINEVLDMTGTNEFRHVPFQRLSGGEKQRVLLAKALVQEPALLLLDEPTNHLDIHHTVHLLQLIKTLQRKQQLSVLAIMHDLNVAALFSDRIALLHEGRVSKMGDVSVLKQEHVLSHVYQVDVRTQAHPESAKPQVFLAAKIEDRWESLPFRSLFTIRQRSQLIHLTSARPLRVISNGVIGEGLEWAQHFCNFHVEQDYVCSNPREDVRRWLREANIPAEHTVSMMTAIDLEDAALVEGQQDNISFLVLATAGVGHAVDIVHHSSVFDQRHVGTINTMVFIDAHLTDGALVNALMSATEAKVKTLADLNILDRETETLATGTPTDSLLIAATQSGTPTPYAGSKTTIGKGIGRYVSQAIRKAIQNNIKRNRQRGEKGSATKE